MRTDHAIIWNPRDVVGGDVYWLRNSEKGSLLCVCDLAIQEIPYRKGNKYYISSDGLYDQIGEDGTKFGYRTLRDIVLALHNRPQGEIVDRVWQVFEEKSRHAC